MCGKRVVAGDMQRQQAQAKFRTNSIQLQRRFLGTAARPKNLRWSSMELVGLPTPGCLSAWRDG